MFGFFDVKDENKNDVEYTEDRGDQRDLWSAGVGRAFRSAGSHNVSLTSVQSTKFTNTKHVNLYAVHVLNITYKCGQ